MNLLKVDKTLPRIIIVSKIILSILLMGGVLGGIYLHSLFSLEGRWDFNDKAIITTNQELILFLTERIKASASMNIQEIVIWILVPMLLVFTVMVMWMKRKFFWFIGLVVIFFLLFLIAQVTNRIGVEREINKSLGQWESYFKMIEYPNMAAYTIEDSKDFENGHRGTISFKITDSVLSVKEFYSNRGFREDSSLNGTFTRNNDDYTSTSLSLKWVGYTAEVNAYRFFIN